MELTEQQKKIADEAVKTEWNKPGGSVMRMVYTACEAVLESRAASAVDQGLRKAAQDANEALRNILNGNDLALERGHSIEGWENSPFRKQGNAAYHALREVLTRQDGPVIGGEPWFNIDDVTPKPEYDTQILLWNPLWERVYVGYWRHSHEWIGSYPPEIIGSNLPDTEPTYWRHIPGPPSLTPRPDPNHPMSGTMQDEVRVTDRAQEPLSQWEDAHTENQWPSGRKKIVAEQGNIPDAECAKCGKSVLVRDGEDWEEGDLCDHCNGDRVKELEAEVAQLKIERDEYQAKSYRNMCRDQHMQIGFEGEDFQPCPVCQLQGEVAQLKADNERLKAPVSDEESRAAGWTSCGQNFEQLRRREVDALLTARTGGSNGK